MNCDRIARWYRWLEYVSFGRALERRRFEYLPGVTGVRRALMLGEGDGRFLAAFVRANKQAAIDSVESSREMMRLAAGRVSARERVTFHHADARRFSFPEGDYDLIVTHFFLDCFSTEETADLISSIARAAAPRARWLISEFHQPGKGFARYWTGPLIRVCYFFFRVATGLETTQLPAYREALHASGFRRASHQFGWRGLLISELWERDLIR
jgi:ubiquinone/menaquinone biosynthesis C-methylase UbiE